MFFRLLSNSYVDECDYWKLEHYNKVTIIIKKLDYRSFRFTLIYMS